MRNIVKKKNIFIIYRMVYKKRYSKKRYYKRFKKGTYQRKYYKRRYKKSYRKTLKRPEVHILKENVFFGENMNGALVNLTTITNQNGTTGYNQSDEVQYKIRDKNIEGKKIRLKYLYIKGYVNISTTAATDDDNICGKVYVFRRKQNLSNNDLGWNGLLDTPYNLNDTSNFSNQKVLHDILYVYDWKNDVKQQVKRKVKNIYRKYDDGNNVLPFKIRIPLYDCVLTCDNNYNTQYNKFNAQSFPSTNGIWLSFITTKTLSGNADNYAFTDNFMKCKYKLYYTDY